MVIGLLVNVLRVRKAFQVSKAAKAAGNFAPIGQFLVKTRAIQAATGRITDVAAVKFIDKVASKKAPEVFPSISEAAENVDRAIAKGVRSKSVSGLGKAAVDVVRGAGLTGVLLPQVVTVKIIADKVQKKNRWVVFGLDEVASL